MMKYHALTREAKLSESEFTVKRGRDVDYLMELKPENLLFSHYAEAGLNGLLNYTVTAHGGWDSPTSQIRGTFAGHWLSAAARACQETGNMQLKAKADFLVSEIGRCQERNGNGWAFPIPEKYLYSLRDGKGFWASQYVCHKNMMGLLDMYLYAGNGEALEIVKKCADWFDRFSGEIPRETMDDMMDLQETGGIMELWADLY
ncbi:MAG: glycoside hydrolase family 127 protein, partial [Oscillospiraceae bacterium]|nr:glycoside hydrolase family 127 protein [Oscillospiraceae bacterium]